MKLTTALAIYFIVWWTVLFAVLPWGVRSQAEGGRVSPGTDPGAPALPNLLHKTAWTTAISAAVFAIMYAFYVNRWVSIDDLATLFGLLR